MIFFLFQALAEMRQISRDTREEPRVVIATATNNLPEAVAHKLPSLPNLKRTVERIRLQNNGPARQPMTLAELEIPADLSQFEDGEPFLFHDSGAGDGNER